ADRTFPRRTTPDRPLACRSGALDGRTILRPRARRGRRIWGRTWATSAGSDLARIVGRRVYLQRRDAHGCAESRVLATRARGTARPTHAATGSTDACGARPDGCPAGPWAAGADALRRGHDPAAQCISAAWGDRRAALRG